MNVIQVKKKKKKLIRKLCRRNGQQNKPRERNKTKVLVCSMYYKQGCGIIEDQHGSSSNKDKRRYWDKINKPNLIKTNAKGIFCTKEFGKCKIKISISNNPEKILELYVVPNGYIVQKAPIKSEILIFCVFFLSNIKPLPMS